MRFRAWTRGVGTVAGLEMRQRVRSKRWIVAIIAWFVLIGAFTLLMAKVSTIDASSGGFGGWNDEPWCSNKAVLEAPDGTFVRGCILPVEGRVVYSSPEYPGGRAWNATVVCATDKDGVVGCWVAEWWMMDGTTCYDTGTGPVCYTERGAPAERALPRPDLGFECTNSADGSTVCSLPGGYYGGTEMMDPPKSCTVRPDRTASCEWVPVDGWTPSAGPLVFGFVVFFVLGLGLLVTPALTAGSINGDRNDGTLATLQVTTLSATQIALGKLVAAWATMAAFLVAALPWIIVSMVVGQISVLNALVCAAVLMGLLAVMCAVGLGWSALVNRTSGSNLLSYTTVVTLSLLTVVFMALLFPLTMRSTEVEVWRLPQDVERRWDAEMEAYWNNPDGATPPAAPFDQCTWFTDRWEEPHTDTTWWLLAANPFVAVADASPYPKVAKTHPQMYSMWGQDPMFEVRNAVAMVATPPATQVDGCYNSYGPQPENSPVEPERLADVRVWPWSLGANLLLGVAFFAIAVRRLKVPYNKLPKGTRVA